MELYTSEDEQVEALKRWWDQNGRSVIVGLIIVLVSVFGWRTWLEHRQNQAESASIGYQVMTNAVQGGDSKAAEEQGQALIAKYPNSTYAILASLQLAKISLDRGEPDAALAHLRWASENAEMPELKLLSRLRLARLLTAQQKADEALKLLHVAEAGSFAAAYDEAKGDAYMALGKRSEARQAYQSARDGYKDENGKRALLKIKLDDLAQAGSGSSKP